MSVQGAGWRREGEIDNAVATGWQLRSRRRRRAMSVAIAASVAETKVGRRAVRRTGGCAKGWRGSKGGERRVELENGGGDALRYIIMLADSFPNKSLTVSPSPTGRISPPPPPFLPSSSLSRAEIQLLLAASPRLQVGAHECHVDKSACVQPRACTDSGPRDAPLQPWKSRVPWQRDPREYVLRGDKSGGGHPRVGATRITRDTGQKCLPLQHLKLQFLPSPDTHSKITLSVVPESFPSFLFVQLLVVVWLGYR